MSANPLIWASSATYLQVARSRIDRRHNLHIRLCSGVHDCQDQFNPDERTVLLALRSRQVEPKMINRRAFLVKVDPHPKELLVSPTWHHAIQSQRATICCLATGFDMIEKVPEVHQSTLLALALVDIKYL